MKLDQCLFGYDDGHKLLSTSLPLGPEASYLTELSDLAPGTVFGNSTGYWTGVPVPAIGRYALLRTWPAPEMPRPGCVWTHVLLMTPAFLEQAADLAVLQTLATRPKGPSDTARYRESLMVDLDHVDDAGRSRSTNGAIVRKLLAALYASDEIEVEVASPGEIEEPLFAVWSQQWPRLRRNFRFQTAASRVSRLSSTTRFDVTAVLMPQSDGALHHREHTEPWLAAAVRDVEGNANGSLRRFLWRYGADVRRQRGSYRPLVEIKLLDDRTPSNSGRSLIEIVTRWFPEKDDAACLKQDLINGVLVTSAQLDLLLFVLSKGGDAVFPPPDDVGVSRLTEFWPTRSDELMHLAESTAGAEDPLGMSVFEVVADSLQASTFWSLTRSHPMVRERLVQARPELLMEDGALELDDSTLKELLSVVPPESEAVRDLIPRLLSRDDKKLALVALERFPAAVAKAVVSAADGDNGQLSRIWFRELVRRPSLLLQSDAIGLVSRTSLLYELADELGWLTQEVLEAGTEPWTAALSKASNDLSDNRRDTLRSFFVALALASGGDGGLRVLENCFDAVHKQALKLRLPWRARHILSPLLPEMGWGRGWDFGLKLRLAVADAYVRNKWPPESYAALASGRKARTMLADAALETPGGEPYAKAAAIL